MAGAAVFRAGGIPAQYTNDNDNDGVLAPPSCSAPTPAGAGTSPSGIPRLDCASASSKGSRPNSATSTSPTLASGYPVAYNRVMVEIRQTEVYARWFRRLRDREARVRIDSSIRRLSLGNPADVSRWAKGFRDSHRLRTRLPGVLRAAWRGPWSSFWPEETRTARSGTYEGHLSWPGDFREVAAMARTQTTPWDPAEHLETEEDMAAYLNVALEEEDLSLIMATLGDIGPRPENGAGRAGDGAGKGEPVQVAVRRRQPGVRHRAQGGARPGLRLQATAVTEATGDMERPNVIERGTRL